MSITLSRGIQFSSLPSLTMIHWSVMAIKVPTTLLVSTVESGQATMWISTCRPKGGVPTAILPGGCASARNPVILHDTTTKVAKPNTQTDIFFITGEFNSTSQLCQMKVSKPHGVKPYCIAKVAMSFPEFLPRKTGGTLSDTRGRRGGVRAVVVHRWMGRRCVSTG